jgi:vancomycin resistance protein YoaR
MKIEISKEKFNHLIRLRNILVGMVIFLIILIFFVILNILNSDKTNLGLRVAGIKIGGLNSQAVEEKIKTINEEFIKKDFSLTYKDYNLETSPEKLGIKIDVLKTTKTAYDYGRTGENFLINSWFELKSFLGFSLNPVWQIDQERLENFLQKNLGSDYQPAQNATLVYDEKKQDFIISPAKEGITVDENKLKKDLEKIIDNSREKNTVRLVLIQDKPEVIESETQPAKEKTEEILKLAPRPITIPENDEETKKIDELDKEKILNLITFIPIPEPQNPNNKILGVSIDEQKTKDYLVSLAPLVNQEPIDAKLSVKDGKVVIFALSQDGFLLNIEENVPILSEIILENKQINFKITKTEPKITTDSIDNLGITALLGKGVSNFSGSPVNRVHNIKIGMAKFSGTLIKPGEEFSFNDILGDVGPEQGYEPELVIKKDKTVPEYGGGLCQVSTTVFRTAINSGLKITERFAHAFPVKYYNPQGFDATIYPPSTDLKFINNTPNYLLLQGKISGSELTFELYGTEDYRKVVIDGPHQYDLKDDGSMKATLTQEVYDKDGNLMFKKTFYSNYKSPDLYPVERNPLE